MIGTNPEPIAERFVDLVDEEHAQDIRGDLASVSAEELARQLRDACDVIEGFVVAAEAINMATLTVLCDAHRRAHEARRRAEEGAGLPVSNW